jgi:hypothetical protein
VRFISVLLFLFCQSAKTQIWVTHERSISTYTELQNAIPLLKDTVWYIIDYPGHVDVNVALDFNFLIYGNAYDHVEIGNGAIWFGSGIMLGAMADLVDRGYGTSMSKSAIFVKKEGLPPHRIVKFEYRNVGFYDEYFAHQTLNDSMSFQVWIYESGNKFECRIGDNSLHDGMPAGYFLSFGIVNVTDSTQNYILKGPPTGKEFTHQFVAPFGLDSCPQAGTVYTFSFGNISSTRAVSASASGFFHDGTALHIPESLAGAPVVIYDATGRTVLRNTSALTLLPTGDLKPGIYTARMFTTDGILSLRFCR